MEPLDSWLKRMDSHLKSLQAQESHEELRECLNLLHRHVEAWDLLYRPPIEEVPGIPVKSGWSQRTIASS